MNKIYLASLALTFSAAVLADDDRGLKPGTQTRAWMELQKTAAPADGASQAMPGEVADVVYQRYVTSFTHPIPETYTRDSLKSGSGGSTGSGHTK